MKPLEFVLGHEKEVLQYLKSKFPMYHLSNFFFRDVQYGIQMIMREKGMKVSYAEAERIARAFTERLERGQIFTPIDRQSWVVRYPEFKTPVTRPAPAAKQAGPAPAVPRAPQATQPPAGVAPRKEPGEAQNEPQNS